MCPSSWTSLPPPPHPTPLGCHRAPDWAVCAIKQFPTNYFTYGMFHCYFLTLSHPLLPPLCSQICSLCLHLYSCPENGYISTIFLIPCYYTIVVFSLPDSLPSNRLYVRPPVICCQNPGVNPGTEHLEPCQSKDKLNMMVGSQFQLQETSFCNLGTWCLTSLLLTLTYIYFIVCLLPPHFHFDSLAWSHLYKALIFDY